MKSLLRVVLSTVISISAVFSISTLAETKKMSGAAPDFTLKSRSGENLRLKEFQGQVVMLNFWASWCGPCRQEMPLLDELYKRYSRAGFTILGVNVDSSPAEANRYLKKIDVSFPVLYDTKSQVSKLFDVSAMPSTVMIDRSGNMRYLHKSYVPGDEAKYRQYIRELIRE